QLSSPLGVAADGAGNLFIADSSNFRVRKFSASGIITTVAGGGTAGLGEGGPATSATLAPSGVAVDGDGNLFIAEASIITRPNFAGPRVRKVSPSGAITTVAGGGTMSGVSADGGPATNAQLVPVGVAVDTAGNLFIADGCIACPPQPGVSHRIRKVSPSGMITTVAGGGAAGLGDGGPATGANISHPAGLAVDGAGDLWIADRGNYRIRKVSPSGMITTAAGNGTGSFYYSTQSGPVGDNGPAISARLNYPRGVAADRAGNVFIADTRNHRIRRGSTGGIVTTVAGNGTGGFSGDGGPATSAQLNSPIAVTVDDAGNLFVLDAANGRVRKISPNGMISTVAGGGMLSGGAADGGPATSATLGGFVCNFVCGGVAVDGSGNLFIASPGSGLRRVSPSGIITTVADAEGFFGDGPAGVAVDAAGNLFMVGDVGVRKVTPSGTVSTVAQLFNALAVAVDGAGNLFVATSNFEGSFNSERILKVSPRGTVTTVAGTGPGDFSGDGGSASTATVNGPAGLALDGAGNLYVADSGNDVVRVLRPANRSVLVGAVVDAASQRDDAVSPGKIVIIYGAGLGPSELVQNRPSGTTVSFNGIAAPVLYSSATQVGATVPYAVTSTTAQVTVKYQEEVSGAFTVPVAASAPSLFTLNQTGAGQAAAINAVDGTVNTAANPVKLGGYISLYATGEGQTTPAGRPVLHVMVTVGGLLATIQYAGSTPGQVAGLMQVNVQIPAGVQPGGYVPVVLQVGDRTSSPAVWIAVSGN
ncbi:MAG: IPT/TIG domain-containing protein, partial [Bryobacteraceae bacterium]